MGKYESLKDKVVFVTGGAGGLGSEICKAFGENGAKVVVASQNEERGAKSVAAVKVAGGDTFFVKVDVTNADSVNAAVAAAVDKWGTVDVLVNNAGGGGGLAYPNFHSVTEAAFDATYNLNTKSTFLCIKAVHDIMINKGYGRIINISSMAGRTPQPELPAYSAQKAAVISLTKTYAIDFAPHGVTVNAVCPGIVYTVMWKTLVNVFRKLFPDIYGDKTDDEIFAAEIKKRIPMNRPQTERDIANAVIFLASDDAQNITAQTLSVDGGASM